MRVGRSFRFNVSPVGMLPERSEAKSATILMTVLSTFVICLIGWAVLSAAYDKIKQQEEADRSACLAKTCPAGQHPSYFDVTKDCSCAIGVLPK